MATPRPPPPGHSSFVVAACAAGAGSGAETCCVHVFVKNLGGVSLRLDSFIGTRSITKSTVSYHFIP